jgi:transposase-like protein
MSHEDEKLGARLPLPGERWVARRKATVITALRNGETTIEDVCRLYSLSQDELASWTAAFERHGLPGLRSTRVQLYRELEKATAGHANRQSPAQPIIFQPGRHH